ncbi:MAG TPA: beta/gamma crystallin domain-containing protein [Oculatellaceae cyanobacterium]|jgi:hypothetical protein
MKNKEKIKPLISSSIIIALSTLANNLVISKNAIAQPPIVVAQTTTDIGATFYEGENLSGKKFTLSKYGVRRELSDSWNDKISSIKIAPNCTVLLYENFQFQGKLAVYEGQTTGLTINKLGVYWNDKISSLKVFCMGINPG